MNNTMDGDSDQGIIHYSYLLVTVNVDIFAGENFMIVSSRCYTWLHFSRFILICPHTCVIVEFSRWGNFPN